MKKLLLLFVALFLLGGCSYYYQASSKKEEVKPNEQVEQTEPSTTTPSTTTPSTPTQNDNVQTTNGLKLGTYKDVNNTYNGASLDTMTLYKDATALERSCTVNDECTDYKGTYSISGKYLYISLTKYQDKNGNWLEIPRDSDAPMEFEVVDSSTFKDMTRKYVFIFAN